MSCDKGTGITLSDLGAKGLIQDWKGEKRKERQIFSRSNTYTWCTKKKKKCARHGTVGKGKFVNQGKGGLNTGIHLC